MNIITKMKFTCIAALVLLATSCGYQFEGGGYLKEDVINVAVLVLDNQTNEVGADLTFTNALIREILEKSDTKVVDEASAEAVLQGSVKAITFSTLSRSDTENVVERRVTVRLDLRLTDSQGKVIWSVKDFSTDEEYTVSDDQVTDDANKNEAIDEVADRASEKIVSKLLVNF